MLRHDDNSESTAPPSPAAQVRVTPQELAAALARLEARQGEREGTIPLGDAVQELGLNATPEELLREIEAGRARQRASHPKTRLAKAGQAAAALTCGGLLLLGGLFAFLQSPPPSQPAVTITAPPAVPQASPIAIPSGLLVRQHDGKMVLLSEVVDGQPVLCLIEGTENSARFTDFAPANVHWTLIKHGGKVYVRGWIGEMSEKALRSTVVQVHPLAFLVSSGLHPIRVTLPVDGFRSPPGLTDNGMISASHVVPDEHLKERW